MSTRNRVVAYLAWLPPFGLFGLHRAYLGRYGTAGLFAFTFGLWGLGWVYDGAIGIRQLLAQADASEAATAAALQQGQEGHRQGAYVELIPDEEPQVEGEGQGETTTPPHKIANGEGEGTDKSSINSTHHHTNGHHSENGVFSTPVKSSSSSSSNTDTLSPLSPSFDSTASSPSSSSSSSSPSTTVNRVRRAGSVTERVIDIEDQERKYEIEAQLAALRAATKVQQDAEEVRLAEDAKKLKELEASDHAQKQQGRIARDKALFAAEQAKQRGEQREKERREADLKLKQDTEEQAKLDKAAFEKSESEKAAAAVKAAAVAAIEERLRGEAEAKATAELNEKHRLEADGKAALARAESLNAQEAGLRAAAALADSEREKLEKTARAQEAAEARVTAELETDTQIDVATAAASASTSTSHSSPTVSATSSPSSPAAAGTERVCSQCGTSKRKDQFSKAQASKSNGRCKVCVG